jgi:hypothetical protein
MTLAPLWSVMQDHEVIWRSLVFEIFPEPEVIELKERVFAAARQLSASVSGTESELDIRAPCFPHMSIIYVSDRSGLTQQSYLSGIQDSVVVNTPEGLIVKFGDHQSVDGFRPCEAWVVKCEGDVNIWEVLEKRSLNSE